MVALFERAFWQRLRAPCYAAFGCPLQSMAASMMERHFEFELRRRAARPMSAPWARAVARSDRARTLSLPEISAWQLNNIGSLAGTRKRLASTPRKLYTQLQLADGQGCPSTAQDRAPLARAAPKMASQGPVVLTHLAHVPAFVPPRRACPTRRGRPTARACPSSTAPSRRRTSCRGAIPSRSSTRRTSRVNASRPPKRRCRRRSSTKCGGRGARTAGC